jgi:uncharacterized protein YhbP (UPF0306 family)
VSDGVRDLVRQMLEAHGTVTLASAGEGGPWAATVFYVSDPALNLYFVSDVRTRHGRELAADARVAGAVNANVHTWDEVRGLQLEGRAVLLPEEERSDAIALYLAKFPDVARLFNAPRDDSERLIGERLRKTAFWRLTPRWFRLIDNRRGFGWKQELTLP